jgi:hypothetical protein
MRDQYGGIIPGDLVVLHFGSPLEPGTLPEDNPLIGFDPVDPADVDAVCAANWYEVQGREGLILASYEEIGGRSELDPLDCGIDLHRPGVRVRRIAGPLKRYSLEDGFYHA